MNYIVLDLEWNQPYHCERLDYKNGRCLKAEIIQIGAVKLDCDKKISDTFCINIRPAKIKVINKNVRELTGIDEKMLENAVDIYKAVETFKSWCGKDYVFITWGYDDIGVLGTNLKYFDIDTSFLPNFYNLQMIYCAQTDNENRQYSLASAAEHFGITLDKPLHNALTDAYYTALICAHLDIQKGIDTYHAMVFNDKSIPEHMKRIKYKRNYEPVNSYEKIIEETKIKAPVCSDCGEKLTNLITAENGFYNFLAIGKCARHGEFAQMVKINRIDAEKYCATEIYYTVDEFNREYFLLKLNKMRASDKRKKSAQRKRAMKIYAKDTLPKEEKIIHNKVNGRMKILASN